MRVFTFASRAKKRQCSLVSADTFLNRTRADPTVRDSLEVVYHGADLQAAARNSRDKRVIYVVGWHRRVRNDGIAKGVCLVSRCHGMLFAPAPRPVWKSTSVSGAHFSAMTRPCCAGSVERRGIGTATPSSRRRVDGVEGVAFSRGRETPRRLIYALL